MRKFVGLTPEQVAEIQDGMDAMMATFTAEYDATAAQLIVAGAKAAATGESNDGQLGTRPEPTAVAPASPTANSFQPRLSSRPKVALKTVSLGALHSGWLTKKGEIRKNWKRRWFEMAPDFTLRYFDKQDEPRQQKGCVVLYNCRVDAPVKADEEHENCIALRPAVLPGRTYYFTPDRAHELEEVSSQAICRCL